MTAWPRVASLKTVEEFRAHLEASGIPLEVAPALAAPGASPLARPLEVEGVRVGNRFCILPMEGWDGTMRGEPSELTFRRWRRFGQSGAKLIWGGEAAAVRPDGRANPNQLVVAEDTLASLERLRLALVSAHTDVFGRRAEADLLVGLQITHSGRWAKPHAQDRPEPLTAYAHPCLDRRFPRGTRVLTDEELDRLVDDFVSAARRARTAGFRFVDVKHCHGYLGHELLSARDRPGRYGGSFENRTRFLREVVAGIRATAPGLGIGVRLSAFDAVPWARRSDGAGVPEADASDYRSGFALLQGEDLEAALAESRELLRLLEGLGVRLVCVTAGSPYYNPHLQRPAYFPPSDGYLPPEDPLRGVARQIAATALLKAAFPSLVIVGSAYSCLQEYLPHVAERVVEKERADFIGLGRMALTYPELPRDVLAGLPLQRKRICRTFSDCTTAPRNGLVSGCFPLDPFYAGHAHARILRQIKKAVTA
jgi:2,4-dienoyl-CoA reductase-like NADH-dependent reductase (Old Yellow Enzyme family)